MRRNYLVVVMTLAVVFGLCAAVGVAEEKAAGKKGAAGAVVGEKAPDFTGTDQAGKPHALADFKDKILVLEWVNSECPYIQRHYAAGTEKALATKYKDKGVVWVGVDSSKNATAEKEADFARRYKFEHPVLVDPDGVIGKAYGAKTTPHVFVIGKDGKVAYAGALDDDPDGEKKGPKNFVDAALKSVLDGKAPEVTHVKPYGCGVKYKN